MLSNFIERVPIIAKHLPIVGSSAKYVRLTVKFKNTTNVPTARLETAKEIIIDCRTSQIKYSVECMIILAQMDVIVDSGTPLSIALGISAISFINPTLFICLFKINN